MIPGFRFGFYSKSYPSQNQHLFKSHQIKVLNNYYSENPPNILRVLLKTNKFQHTISYVADNHYLYVVKSIKNETIQTI